MLSFSFYFHFFFLVYNKISFCDQTRSAGSCWSINSWLFSFCLIYTLSNAIKNPEGVGQNEQLENKTLKGFLVNMKAELVFLIKSAIQAKQERKKKEKAKRRLENCKQKMSRSQTKWMAKEQVLGKGKLWCILLQSSSWQTTTSPIRPQPSKQK